MLIAHLSDPHVCRPGAFSNGVVDTNACLRRAVAHVAALAPVPDCVLMTGDLVESGAPEEYAVLRELLAPLEAPVYLLPGNHDGREALRAAFPDHGYLPREGPFLHYALALGPLRLVALDTVEPGRVEGLLCEARLAWLAGRLEEAPAVPTLVCMHHPPFETGLPMDRHMLRNGAEVGELIARHPQVERVLCGHVHRPVQLRWRGTLGCIAPSTAHQVVLELTPGAPSTFTLEPPGYLLHQWREGTGLVTHYGLIGSYPGPYRFQGGG
jgi:3',5'-cyclic AMP phosphodiesterase CpdA